MYRRPSITSGLTSKRSACILVGTVAVAAKGTKAIIVVVRAPSEAPSTSVAIPLTTRVLELAVVCVASDT